MVSIFEKGSKKTKFLPKVGLYLRKDFEWPLIFSKKVAAYFDYYIIFPENRALFFTIMMIAVRPRFHPGLGVHTPINGEVAADILQSTNLPRKVVVCVKNKARGHSD